MTNPFSSLCDDFYVDLYINTELELPKERDTILTFFERIQKQFPSMGRFYKGQRNEFSLEQDRQEGQCRWVTLESDRIGSGVVNPARLRDAYQQHRLVVELIPYMLSVSHLDIASLDVTFAMDFECSQNHDDVIAEALGPAAFNALLDNTDSKVVDFSPSMIIAISDDRRTQARVSIDSRTSVYNDSARNSANGEEPISLSFAVRQYPSPHGRFDPLKSFDMQCKIAEQMMSEKVVPNIVQPLTSIIAQRRLT